MLKLPRKILLLKSKLLHLINDWNGATNKEQLNIESADTMFGYRVKSMYTIYTDP